MLDTKNRKRLEPFTAIQQEMSNKNSVLKSRIKSFHIENNKFFIYIFVFHPLKLK